MAAEVGSGITEAGSAGFAAGRGDTDEAAALAASSTGPDEPQVAGESTGQKSAASQLHQPLLQQQQSPLAPPGGQPYVLASPHKGGHPTPHPPASTYAMQKGHDARDGAAAGGGSSTSRAVRVLGRRDSVKARLRRVLAPYLATLWQGELGQRFLDQYKVQHPPPADPNGLPEYVQVSCASAHARLHADACMYVCVRERVQGVVSARAKRPPWAGGKVPRGDVPWMHTSLLSCKDRNYMSRRGVAPHADDEDLQRMCQGQVIVGWTRPCCQCA